MVSRKKDFKKGLPVIISLQYQQLGNYVSKVICSEKNYGR